MRTQRLHYRKFSRSLSPCRYPVLPFWVVRSRNAALSFPWQVDDCAEALDAAAVEAALSLCEDAAAGHALSGPWESADPSGPAPDPLDSAPDNMDLPANSLDSSSAHVAMEIKQEEGVSGGGARAVPAPSPPAASEDTQTEGGSGQAQNQGGADGDEGGPVEATPSPSVKCESEEWTQPGGDIPCPGVYIAQTHTRTRTHACTRTHTHTHTHTHAHTGIHTHTPPHTHGPQQACW